MEEKLNKYNIGILPWLPQLEPVLFSDYSIIPSHNKKGELNPIFEGFEEPITKILSNYIEEWKGLPFTSCAVITSHLWKPSWMFDINKFDEVYEVLSGIFISAISLNRYFQQLGQYINESMFQLFIQSFSLPLAGLAVSQRRRDGTTTGYIGEHGKVKFSKPYECRNAFSQTIKFDIDLLNALLKLKINNISQFELITRAISYFRLANTDQQNFPLWNELALMTFAFECLLQPECTKAHCFSNKISELFNKFGNISVEIAAKTRSIKVVESQKNNWIHTQWAYDLYTLRGMIAHAKPLSYKISAWSIEEHLQIGAIIFPLAVKLFLAEEGCYKLTPEDQGKCFAIDPLLATINWHERDNDNNSNWTKVLDKITNENSIRIHLEEVFESIKRRTTS